MPKKGQRPVAGKPPWKGTAVEPEDLETAKREALLQLRIGRASHLSAVVVSALLAVDALALLFLVPTLPSLTGSQTGLVAFEHSFYLAVVIAGGLAVAGVGLATKWEAFQMWPWEPHFATSVGAFALNVVLLVLYAARLAGAGPLGHLAIYPLLFPFALVGISAALLGVVASWTPWGARQWTSALTAVLPIATAALVYLPSTATRASSEALAVALLISAVLYQTSGSFLHLLSSGTGPHEEALVATGQNRIARLADELKQRDVAIRYREAALVKREADAEATEGSLRRARDAHDARVAELEKFEEEDHARADALAARERELAGKVAALGSQSATIDEQRKALDVRTAELGRQTPEVAAREERLAHKEGELTRREVEVAQRTQVLDRREAAARDGEARLAARLKEVDGKTADLLRREGAVAARERPGAPATGTTITATGQDLGARELRVQHLKSLLDEQNVQLGRRAKEVAEQAKVAEGALRQIAERQAHLAARESALSQREADLQDRLKAADERRLQFETAARDYQQRLEEVGRQQVDVARKGADVDGRTKSLAERERSLNDRETRLKTTSAELDRREGEIVLRERSVDADEAEVSLRRQGAGVEGDLPFAGLLAIAAADRAGPDSGPSRSSRGRRGRPVLGAQETTTADAGTLAPQTGRKYADRLPTGTPRLDDLLLGGLPPKSHTALVGPAFVGKEILLYAFLAEGLKRSEPVLLVTASRTSSEISESLGVVLPQFREYEQMGMVNWIDASGAGGTSGPGRRIAKSSDDHAGILTALVAASKETEASAKGGVFRVGFLGLSAALTHADERASLSFLQNVVGILKPRSALAMYALEAGALSEAQVEALLGRMDGAIIFRQERDRTFLSVKGYGDVATREWVEVRATSRNLVVGSFALERIR